jgi:hypothetical protein
VALKSTLLRDRRWILLFALGITLLGTWYAQIDDGALISDAQQSLQLAINLQHEGVLSLDPAPPFRPSNFREPLSPIVTAAGIGVEDAVAGSAPSGAYFVGKRLRFLKYQNLAWLAALALGAFWATRCLTSSFFFGIVAVILASFRPHFPPGFIDDLMTEIPAAALLILASAFLAIGFDRRNVRLMASAGALFGLLTLIKAIALYAFLGLIPVLACLYAIRGAISVRTAAIHLGLPVACFACVVAPWIIRDRIELNTFEITQRASYALQERWYEDQMSIEELKGAVYWWAPYAKQKIGSLLGFSERDLLPGGRLQRLNDDPDSAISQIDLPSEMAGMPDQAITFYRRARAEVWRVGQLYQSAKHPFPDVAAEAAVKQEAVTAIRSHLWRHLAVSPLFLWRSSAKTAPILLLALAFGLWDRRWNLVLFVLPALSIVAGYALMTPYFPRYDYPMHVVALVTLAMLGGILFSYSKSFRLTASAMAR